MCPRFILTTSTMSSGFWGLGLSTSYSSWRNCCLFCINAATLLHSHARTLGFGAAASDQRANPVMAEEAVHLSRKGLSIDYVHLISARVVISAASPWFARSNTASLSWDFLTAKLGLLAWGQLLASILGITICPELVLWSRASEHICLFLSMVLPGHSSLQVCFRRSGLISPSTMGIPMMGLQVGMHRTSWWSFGCHCKGSLARIWHFTCYCDLRVWGRLPTPGNSLENIFPLAAKQPQYCRKAPCSKLGQNHLLLN